MRLWLFCGVEESAVSFRLSRGGGRFWSHRFGRGGGALRRYDELRRLLGRGEFETRAGFLPCEGHDVGGRVYKGGKLRCVDGGTDTLLEISGSTRMTRDFWS